MTNTLEQVGSFRVALDRIEMQDVLACYAWGYDEGDFEMLAGTFTEDGTTSGTVANSDAAWGPTKGNREIAEVLRAIREQQVDQRRHTIHTTRVENQTEDTATLYSYVTITASQDGTTRTLTAGWYKASMVRREDAWYMQDLIARLDSPF